MKESCNTARFNLLESIVNLKDLSNLSGYEKIGESINKFSEDESWRVRFIISKFIPELLELSNKIKNNNDIRIIILRVYIKLLQDPEGEVRSMESKKLNVTSESLGK